MQELLDRIKQLEADNAGLLKELEVAYTNIATVLEESEREKEIAYRELERKYKALEDLYSQLSNKENMLIHLEKLSSIGQFITEIIHELKNPLSVISGMTELIMIDPNLPDSVRQRVEKIPKQVKRMSSYLNRFKAMAYKGREDFTIFNLNDNLRDFLETIEIIKPKDITLESQLCPESLYIQGDPNQTTQIYLNLAKNAFDAMKEKGSIFRVQSQKISREALFARRESMVYSRDLKSWADELSEQQEFALLEFSDDGSGIPGDVIENIFEAFFTTKERGKGTGLGLSIATDITHRHNATLTVFSIRGEGTTFKLAIPLAEGHSKESTLVVENKELFI